MDIVTNYKLHSRSKTGWVRRIVAAETVTIPGRLECILPAYTLFSGTPILVGDSSEGWITEHAAPIAGVHVSRVLLPDRNVDLPVRV